MCLPRVIKSFQNYRGVATTLYPTLVVKISEEVSNPGKVAELFNSYFCEISKELLKEEGEKRANPWELPVKSKEKYQFHISPSNNRK